MTLCGLQMSLNKIAISGPFISLVSLGHVSISPSSTIPVCVSLNVPQLRQGLQIRELRIDLAEGELVPTHPHIQWVPATCSKEWSGKDVKLINRLHPLQKLIICGAVPPLFLWFRGVALKSAIPLLYRSSLNTVSREHKSRRRSVYHLVWLCHVSGKHHFRKCSEKNEIIPTSGPTPFHRYKINNLKIVTPTTCLQTLSTRLSTLS